MKIALCDDNITVLDFLEDKITTEFGKRFELIKYDNVQNLWQDCEIYDKRADILLMDICFPDNNGVDIARKIQECYADIKIIFITGYPELASQIFRAVPTFLLIKPINEDLLYEAVATAEKQIQEENDKAICVSYNSSIQKIKPHSIYYIERNNRTSTIYWTGGSFIAKQSLEALEEMLPSETFIRIHKSFLVNMAYITAYNYEQLTLTTSTILPISHAKAKHVREKFTAYLRCH